MDWGFDIETAEKEAMTPANLTAGKYKVLIEDIEFGIKLPGQSYETLQEPSMDENAIIRIKTILSEPSNGFASGWHHDIFLRTQKPGTAGQIARGQFAMIIKAVGCEACKDKGELIGKQFWLTLVQQKNNPDYTNISKIEAIESGTVPSPSAEPTPTTTESTAAQSQALPLGSTVSAPNDDTPSWV